MTDNTNSKKKVKYILVIAAVLATVFMMTSCGSNANKVNDSKKFAEELYAAKVTDINDTAAIVDLFEVMELEDRAGEYTVEISQEGENLVLVLNVAISVNQEDKETFDKNMEVCAQQMLALIPQVDRVQWVYSVTSSSNKAETAVMAVNHVDFNKSLGNAPAKFGESVDAVLEMLKKQSVVMIG